MDFKVEELTIGEYKDLDDFKQLKSDCYNAAIHDNPIDFGKLPSHEYKYFSELYVLYSDLTHGKITEEQAREQESKNYRELSESKAAEERYLWALADWQNNIRIVGDNMSKLCQATEINTALEYALDIAERLTHNFAIKTTVYSHLGINPTINS